MRIPYLHNFSVNELFFTIKLYVGIFFLGNMATQDCILGMEFSGRNSGGNKVMGLLPAKVIYFLYISKLGYKNKIEN